MANKSTITITAKDKASKTFRALRQEINSTEKSAKLLTPAFVSASAAGAAFGAVLVKSVKEFAAFEKGLAEVSTLLGDTSGIDALSKEVRDLSVAFGGNATKNAKALYDVISAGAENSAQAIGILTQANKLALGGVTDINTATDGLTSALNAYRLSGLTATEASDALFVAMRGGKTTIGELSKNLGLVAPLAAQSGISFDELTASVSALTTAGVKTPAAVTQIRSVLTALVKVTPLATKEAERLGLEFNSTALKSKGLAGFLKEVKDKVGDNTDAYGKLFGSVEAINAVLSLTGGAAESFTSILGGMEEKIGETDKAAALMRDTLAFEWDVFAAGVNDLAISYGDFLAPALRDTLAAANDLIFALRALASPEDSRDSRLAQLQQLEKAIIENQKKVDKLTNSDFFKANSENVFINDAIDKLDVLKAKYNELNQTLETNRKTIIESEGPTSEYAKAIEELGDGAPTSAIKLEGLRVVIEGVGDATETYDRQKRQSTAYTERLNDGLKNSRDIAEELKKETLGLKEATLDYNVAMQMEVDLLKIEATLGKDARRIQEALNDAKESGVKVSEEAIIAHEETVIALEKQIAASEDVIDVYGVMAESFQTAMGDQFFAVLKEGEFSFKAFADAILDTFLRMIAEMAAAWATSKIFGVGGLVPSFAGFGSGSNSSGSPTIIAGGTTKLFGGASTSTGAGGGIAASAAGSGALSYGGFSATAGPMGGIGTAPAGVAYGGQAASGGAGLAGPAGGIPIVAAMIGLYAWTQSNMKKAQQQAIEDFNKVNASADFGDTKLLFGGRQGQGFLTGGSNVGNIANATEGVNLRSGRHGVLSEDGRFFQQITGDIEKAMESLKKFSPEIQAFQENQIQATKKQLLATMTMSDAEDALMVERQIAAAEFIESLRLATDESDRMAQLVVDDYGDINTSVDEVTKAIEDGFISASEAAALGLDAASVGMISDLNGIASAARIAQNEIFSISGGRGEGRSSSITVADLGFPSRGNQGGGKASGGIARGPLSGYQELLHGTEAVIPLGNGDRVKAPVVIQGGGGDQMLAKEVRRLTAAIEVQNRRAA